MQAAAPAALHAEPVRSHEQFAAVWQDALHQIGDPQLETVRLCWRVNILSEQGMHESMRRVWPVWPGFWMVVAMCVSVWQAALLGTTGCSDSASATAYESGGVLKQHRVRSTSGHKLPMRAVGVAVM